MPGRSKVWRLASFVDERRSEVECSLCPVRIKYVGNTTNIARHLELRHPVEFAALDPTNAGAGRGSGLGRQHPHRPHQQNREEAAICRILAQHREELKKQRGSDEPQPATPSSCLLPAQRWTWHTPVQGEYCVLPPARRSLEGIILPYLLSGVQTGGGASCTLLL
uniref:BED-type domain-containing protein n=1 Tax=Scylla olivacea TaxID=85551 RepID=A0A0P4WN10_SCYOL